MIRLLTTALALALIGATPALAGPDKAQKALERVVAQSTKAGPARTTRKIKQQDVAAFRALMTDAYGAPQSDRSGVQVWDIPTPDRSAGRAETTTVMIGTDKQGRPVIIVDDRPASQGIAPSQSLQRARQAATKSEPALSARRVDADVAE